MPFTWINPVAPERPQADLRATMTARQGELRIGVLDNSKANADELLRLVMESVKQSYPASSMLWLRKLSPASAASPDAIQTLVRECDFVLSAMAD